MQTRLLILVFLVVGPAVINGAPACDQEECLRIRRQADESPLPETTTPTMSISTENVHQLGIGDNGPPPVDDAKVWTGANLNYTQNMAITWPPSTEQPQQPEMLIEKRELYFEYSLDSVYWR